MIAGVKQNKCEADAEQAFFEHAVHSTVKLTRTLHSTSGMLLRRIKSLITCSLFLCLTEFADTVIEPTTKHCGHLQDNGAYAQHS